MVQQLRAGIERAYRQFGDDPEAWRAYAASRDFGEVNTLIRQHNEWYPIERDLPMDIRTRDYVRVGGRSHRRPLLGPEWALQQFPPTA